MQAPFDNLVTKIHCCGSTYLFKNQTVNDKHEINKLYCLPGKNHLRYTLSTLHIFPGNEKSNSERNKHPEYYSYLLPLSSRNWF